MAQNEFEWAFKLTDKFASPAKQIASNLRQVDDLLVKMTQHEKQLAIQLEKDPFKKQKAALELYRDKLKQQNDVLAKNKERTDALSKGSKFGALIGGLGGLAAVGIAAAGAVAAIGVAASSSAISTASLKRNTLSAFTVLTGSKDEAKALYDQITRIADVAPFETKDVSAMFRSLLGGGFKKDEIENTLKGVFDVGAIIGGDEGKNAAQSIVGTMLQIRSIGKLTFEDMKQISQAAGGLIPIDKIAQQIATMRKVTQAEALKLVSDGKVTAAEGQKALLNVIQQTADKGGPLGTASLEFGTASLEGVLSTLKSRFAHLLEDVDITPIIKLIATVSNFFNTDAGLKAKKVFTGIFDDLFKVIGSLAEGDTLGNIFGGVVTATKFLVDIFKKLWPIAAAFWEGVASGFGIAKTVISSVWEVVSGVFASMGGGVDILGAVIGALTTIAKVLGYVIAAVTIVSALILGAGTIIQALPAILMTAAVALYTAGANLIGGLWQGIKDRFAQILTEWPALVNLLPKTVQMLLGIHSDSRVMKQLGIHTAGGFETGLVDGATGVTSAIDNMAAPPTAARLTGGGGNSMSFGDIGFTFGTGPADQNEAREYGRTAAHEFKTTVAKLMSGAALEIGAG